jgi:hypothetical protein
MPPSRQSRARRSRRQRQPTTLHTTSTVMRIANSITCSSVAATSTATRPVLSSATDWASYAALYDEFKINSVSITVNGALLVPYLTAGTNGAIATAIDPASPSTGVAYAALTDYQNFSLHQLTSDRPYLTRTWRVPQPVFGGVFVNPWQPVTAVDTTYFGSFLFSSLATAAATAAALPYVITLRCSFRMRR